MVSSKESFSSLQSTDVPSIHMGDDTQIRAEGKGYIKLKHGKFNDVLYVPSLASNLLCVYHMTHTIPPKQVVFGPESMEITYISIGKIIVKGAENHASKAYEFSDLFPFLEPVHSLLALERGGKNILSTPFIVSTSISELEAKDSVVSI